MRSLNYFMALNLLIGLMAVGCTQNGQGEQKTPTPTSRTLIIPTSPLPNIVSPEVTLIPTFESTTPTPGPTALKTAESQVTITGWFTTIWNGGPHYSITDDNGTNIVLLLEDEIAKPLGGPLELDRKRVTIVGVLISDAPRTVRVLSVKFANPN